MSAQVHLHDSVADASVPDLSLRVLQKLLLAGTPAARADCIAADPGLCLSLLTHVSARGLPLSRLQRGRLIEALNPQQFECWLQAEVLRALGAPAPSAADSAWRRQSLLRAHCAQRLAQAAQYHDSDETYLCALLLEAAGSALPGETGAAAAQRHLALLTALRLPPAAQDAMRYQYLPFAELQGTHRLTQILHLAQQLSPELAADHGSKLGSELESLCRAARQDVEQLERTYSAQAAPLQALAADAYRLWSLGTGVDASSDVRIRASWQAWFGVHPLLLLRHERTRGLLCGGGAEWPYSVEDRSSAATRALHEQTLQRFTAPAGHGRASLADEQMARTLGRSGFICLPLMGTGTESVLLIGADPETQDALLVHSDQLMRFAVSAAALIACETAPAPEALPVPSPDDTAVSLPPPRVREVLHEAAAPLTTLRNYLHVLHKRQPAEELRIMREELERLSQILQQLREPGASSPRGLADLNQLVQDVLQSLRLNWPPPRHTLDSALDAQLSPLTLDSGALKQILINLAHNALEAMPRGGHLHLHTRSGVNVDGVDSVLIEISDDGPGIPAGLQSQLFAPKSSAKPGHSGLGLSIVHRLVRELGGSISCISGASGTRFQIFLPRVAPHPES